MNFVICRIEVEPAAKAFEREQPLKRVDAGNAGPEYFSGQHSEFARIAHGILAGFTVGKEGAAEAASDEHQRKIVESPCGTPHAFTHSGHGRVVLKMHGQAGCPSPPALPDPLPRRGEGLESLGGFPVFIVDLPP